MNVLDLIQGFKFNWSLRFDVTAGWAIPSGGDFGLQGLRCDSNYITKIPNGTIIAKVSMN